MALELPRTLLTCEYIDDSKAIKYGSCTETNIQRTDNIPTIYHLKVHFKLYHLLSPAKIFILHELKLSHNKKGTEGVISTQNYIYVKHGTLSCTKDWVLDSYIHIIRIYLRIRCFPQSKNVYMYRVITTTCLPNAIILHKPVIISPILVACKKIGCNQNQAIRQLH